MKERVLTFGMEEIGFKAAYAFQYVVYYGYHAKTLSEWKTKCRKMVKFLNAHEVEFSIDNQEKAWRADIKLNHEVENQFTLLIDKSKSIREATNMLMQSVPGAVGKAKNQVDVFNVKFLTEEEQSELNDLQ